MLILPGVKHMDLFRQDFAEHLLDACGIQQPWTFELLTNLDGYGDRAGRWAGRRPTRVFGFFRWRCYEMTGVKVENQKVWIRFQFDMIDSLEMYEMWKIPNLTNIFQMGWNHQLVILVSFDVYLSHHEIKITVCFALYFLTYS